MYKHMCVYTCTHVQMGETTDAECINALLVRAGHRSFMCLTQHTEFTFQ